MGAGQALMDKSEVGAKGGRPSRMRRAAAFPGGAVVASFTLLDMFGTPVFSPLARRLVETGPIAWVRDGSRRLPAYAALVALAVPFIVAEPAKVYGLVLIGRGHFVWGVATILLAYLVSLVLVDTILEGAKPQLRSIGWFARLLDWMTKIKIAVTEYVTATRPYLFLVSLFARS